MKAVPKRVLIGRRNAPEKVHQVEYAERQIVQR